MKAQVGILFLLLITGLFTCSKDYGFPANCKGYTAGGWKQHGGHARAEPSYIDWEGYAIFNRGRVADTLNGGWKHDDSRHSFSFNEISPTCREKSGFVISNIKIGRRDTIPIFYSRAPFPNEFQPTALFFITDADALIETYVLIPEEEHWLIIESVSPDSSEVYGRFQLSFVTDREDYLTGERERWDDPLRPDTLRFTNGSFQANFSEN